VIGNVNFANVADCWLIEQVDLGMVSYVINKGHSIRLVVTSSFWPYYSANPNTGELLRPPPASNHTIWPVWPDHVKNVTARNVVHHGLRSVLRIPEHKVLY
jgi:predicted acyl esterase